MSGSSCQEDGSGGAAARTSKKQSVNFDLPLSDSDRGKSTVDGFTLVVGRHKRLAPECKVQIFIASGILMRCICETTTCQAYTLVFQTLPVSTTPIFVLHA